MTYPLNFAGRSLVALLLIATGLSTFGCGDSATVSEPAELGNLSVSEGELRPPFTPATTSYIVQLSPDKSSTTITASPRVSGDTIRIDNQPTTSQTVTLGSPGAEQSVSIVVTDSGAGGASKSYTVRVRRDAEDNSLLALSVSTGILSPSPFEKDTLDYTVNGVASSATRITISATKSDPTSIMQIDSVTVPAGTPSGEATVDLGSTGSSTPLEIVISRPSGTSRTYTVSINRGPSDNNDLGGITISPGSLSPAFRANRTAYTVNLPATLASNVTSVRITPRLQDSTATMSVNGQTATSGQAQTTPLPAPGSRVSNSIIVIAQNNTSKIYTVDVVREALGGNNSLQSVGVSPGSLSPEFNANTTSYTVDVGSGVDSVTVTPRLQDTDASMTVNGQATNSGQARSVALNGPGSNTLINVVVVAQNSSQKLYTVTVSRAALGGNNNLSALTMSPGNLSPSFSANTTNYTVNVGSGVNSVTVTPTEQDTAATTTVNGQATNSGQARNITLNGAGSDTDINIVVTAPNSAQKTYTITVERAAPASNNNLSGLDVTPGPLVPDFTQNTLNYTVDVASDVTSVDVSATKADPNAVISGSLSNTGQATIPLNGAGETTPVSITVTAPSGTSKTYTIDINRAEPSVSLPSTPTSAPNLIAADDSCSPGIPPEECAPGTTKDDNITNVVTPRFSVAAPAGMTPKIYINGAKDDNSIFDQGTLRPSAPLNDGDYDITYTLTNAGGESGQSPPMTPQLRIITAPPPPPGS